MGIGLVDPILPAIAKNLDATPSQVSLLFTSYFLVTAALPITGYVSSRIGGKKTLLIGLAVIVVFASLSGLSGSVEPTHRLPRWLGPGQRTLRGHRPGRHCGRGKRRCRNGDHPLRGGARPGYFPRPAPRRPAGRLAVAGAVLRHRRAHGGSLHRAHRVVAQNPVARAEGPAARPATGFGAQGTADDGGQRPVLQLRLLHHPRLHAVHPGHGRLRHRRGVLRLGRGRCGLLGLRGARAAEPLSAPPGCSPARWPS